MNESLSLGGRPAIGFALGDASTAVDPGVIVRSAAAGAVLGGVVGSLVDYTRTGAIHWGMPATFAGVGAIGGAILGAI